MRLLLFSLTLAFSVHAAEQRPNIVVIVDPLIDPSGDWAAWVTPRVVLR